VNSQGILPGGGWGLRKKITRLSFAVYHNRRCIPLHLRQNLKKKSIIDYERWRGLATSMSHQKEKKEDLYKTLRGRMRLDRNQEHIHLREYRKTKKNIKTKSAWAFQQGRCSIEKGQGLLLPRQKCSNNELPGSCGASD